MASVKVEINLINATTARVSFYNALLVQQPISARQEVQVSIDTDLVEDDIWFDIKNELESKIKTAAEKVKYSIGKYTAMSDAEFNADISILHDEIISAYEKKWPNVCKKFNKQKATLIEKIEKTKIKSEDLSPEVKESIKNSEHKPGDSAFNTTLNYETNSQQAYKNQSGGSASSNLTNNVSNQTSSGVANSSLMKATGTTLSMVQSSMSIAATAAELTNICVQKVTDEVMSYLTDKTSLLLSFDLNRISKLSAASLQTYLLTTAQIISELTSNTEDLLEGASEAAQEELTNGIMGSITTTINKLTSKINGRLDKFTYSVFTITENISKGEDWLIDNMNNATYLIINECKKEIGAVSYTIEQKKENFYQNIADKQARKTAGPTNNKLMAATKKTLDTVSQLKEKAKTLAKTLIKVVLMKLKGMLGG